MYNYNVHLKLYWIFGHVDIKNNEMINKIIEKTHSFILFSLERFYHEVITRISFIRILSRKIWNKRWKEKIKEI